MTSGKGRKKSAVNVQKPVSEQGNMNPKLAQWLKSPAENYPHKLLEGLKNGDRTALGRAITIIESTAQKDFDDADIILNGCLPSGESSIRIGITGVPGVGKSTFIEHFGMEWIRRGHKVAVLAVDPSSSRTGGSILGDKTRMDKLSGHEMAFIRPSPSSGSLGGVARKTRETIHLCEAAGFDIILIETVGVGQSEVHVKQMVDAFVLLLLPGAGDELQGMKRGIMEMADLILVNKADGEQIRKAELAAGEVQRALKLYPNDERDWTVPVSTCSATEGTGIDKAIADIEKFRNHMKIKGFWESARRQQTGEWFNDALNDALRSLWLANPARKKDYEKLMESVLAGTISPVSAARQLLNQT